MAIELDTWLKTGPEAPNLEQAPQGWHTLFNSLFTIYAPGKPDETASI
ncbi:MAG TPA: hypothetical protein VI386_04255 [Candidatus Sulfotelmatobacter sp.]